MFEQSEHATVQSRRSNQVKIDGSFSVTNLTAKFWVLIDCLQCTDYATVCG